MFFGHKKYQKWGCHGQKSEFFSNVHIYSPRQDFLVSFIFSISGFVWLESCLLDFGGGDECIPLVCLAHTGRGARTLSPKEKENLVEAQKIIDEMRDALQSGRALRTVGHEASPSHSR